MPRWARLLIVVGVSVCLYLIPTPQGLSADTWHLFAIYIGAMVGLVARPFSEPVLFITAVAICSILFRQTSVFLEGYSEGIPWLIFSAFMIGASFIKTGLGPRVAYLLIGLFGKTTLGLGYVMTFTDALLAFVTPSNAARTGGIVLPIIRGVAKALDSDPGPTARRIGSYLILNAYQVSLTTGYLTLTGVAPNLLIAKFAHDILGVQVTWPLWFAASIVPSGIMLLLIPYIVYKFYPPELKRIDNKKLSAEGLAALGPMSGKEKILVSLFVLAILGWTTGSITKIDVTAVALGVMSMIMVTGILTWEDIMHQHQAWHTLIWYGGILGLVAGLVKGKFFIWMASVIKASFSFGGMDPMLILFIITVFSLLIRYFFASGGAYVATMVPVFYTIGLIAQIPVLPLALVLAFSHCYGSLMTHYGSSAGVILQGTGYVPVSKFWQMGPIIAAVSLILTFASIPYWKLIGLW
ncbi:MAG: DASS family sodium-coupled anion symporter [Negativicutes bacterium]|nr:DASS family sodium-coupled anion symporter [Negativicutes bacterium]